MERGRSKSIDISYMGPSLLNITNVARSRKSFDAGSLLVPNLLDSRSRYGGSRKSLDAGRARRPSRLSVDVGVRGSRRNLSYDAWLRGIRVSEHFETLME